MSKFTRKELCIIALLLDEDESKYRNRRFWVHKALKKREIDGEYATLFKELIDDESKFFIYFRMSKYSFNILLSKIEINLQKKDTHWRKSISPREQLAVCLRFLATGDSFRTISFSYRLGYSTVHNIVSRTCRIITENLLAEFIPQPTNNDWERIASEFRDLWHFPNCIGAIDGKHVVIKAPPNSGSLYYNYKKTFSVVLLALVDARYNFTAVDVGSYGKNSDGGILMHSKLGQALENRTLNIPPETFLPGTTHKVPHVIVGDEAFPLKNYILRPFFKSQLNDAKRVFNHRLSHARRLSENVFRILAQKFQIYNRRIQAKPENIDFIVLSTCILHNFIRKFDSNMSHIPPVFPKTSINEKDCFETLPKQGGNATSQAFTVREIFTEYFISDIGAVPWQYSD